MSVEIVFRSTGSVSDFFVSPDGTSGRLYKTGVLDISVARAFTVTPPVHLTVSVPLYSKWHETHKGVHRSACCERFAKQVWTKVPGLWSSEQVRDLQTENRQDECSDSSIAHKGCSIVVSSAQEPEYSTSHPPEDHVKCDTGIHEETCTRVRQHNHVPRLQ